MCTTDSDVNNLHYEVIQFYARVVEGYTLDSFPHFKKFYILQKQQIHKQFLQKNSDTLQMRDLVEKRRMPQNLRK